MDFILASLLIILLDQISKYIIDIFLNPHESIALIENILHITYVQNFGAAFSILQGKTLFFTVVSLIIIILMIYIVFKIPITKKSHRLVFSMIVGGAVGNLIDRIRFGYVIDFIDFRIWPVFNIADCAIVIGVLFLAYIIAFDPDVDRLCNSR